MIPFVLGILSAELIIHHTGILAGNVGAWVVWGFRVAILDRFMFHIFHRVELNIICFGKYRLGKFFKAVK